jgi:hypothetical protein
MYTSVLCSTALALGFVGAAPLSFDAAKSPALNREKSLLLALLALAVRGKKMRYSIDMAREGIRR